MGEGSSSAQLGCERRGPGRLKEKTKVAQATGHANMVDERQLQVGGFTIRPCFFRWVAGAVGTEGSAIYGSLQIPA